MDQLPPADLFNMSADVFKILVNEVVVYELIKEQSGLHFLP